MKRTFACLVLAGLLAGTGGARAQAPDLFPAAAPAQANALPAQTASVSDWSSRITFINRAQQAREVRVESFASGPQGAIALTVARAGADGKTTPIAGNGLVQLEPGANLDLVASANLAAPGTYTVFVRLLGANGAEASNASIAVTRTPDTLPADGVVKSPVLTSFFSGTSQVDLSLPISSAAGRPLAFTVNGTTVAKVGDGGESRTQLQPETKLTCPPAAEQKHGPYLVGERDTCSLEMTIADVSPGDYRVRFDLAGTGGGTRAVEMPFKVRAWVGWLVILLIVGAVPGAFVAWWRDRERARSAEALRVARLQDELARRLQSASLPPETAALLTPFRDQLQALRTRIADGEALNAIETERTAAADKLGKLRKVLYLWLQAEPAQRDAAKRELAAALRLVSLGPADKIDAAVEALRTKLHPADTLGGEAGGNIPLPDVSGTSTLDDAMTIARTIGINDLLNSAILFGFFVLVVIVTVWWPDPQWGSVGDGILAVMIGAGAFGTMAATLGTFRTNIQASRGSS